MIVGKEGSKASKLIPKIYFIVPLSINGLSCKGFKIGWKTYSRPDSAQIDKINKFVRTVSKI